MPVLQISNSTPLSLYWTYESVVSEAMVLTNTLDNENIQIDNIRNHLNKNISYIVNLLNIASAPFYGIWMRAKLENVLHPSGLEYIDLRTQVNNTVPAQIVSSIRRINVASNNDTEMAWIGNCTRKDLSEISELNGRRNVQYRHSILWTHHGNELLFLVGDMIRTNARDVDTYNYDITEQDFVIWGYRKPILDDVRIAVHESAQQANNGNYRSNVDLPDEYVELVLKMTQKNILEQIREQIPQALEQEINQGIANINQMIINEMQYESAEREKRRYGMQQKMMGGYQ